MLGKVLAATAVLLLLTRRGVAECYSEVDCGGIEIASSGSETLDQRDCCVNQNGLSYNDGGTCRPCIVHGFRQSSFDVAEDARLDTVFALNVTGTTQFPGGLVISGTITAEAAGTASNSDFERLEQLTVIIDSDDPSTDVRLFTVNDEITLEFEDRVLLKFTPALANLIPGLESNFEFIRNTTIVNIIDNDPLQINFGESDYSIEEGSDMLSSTITLQFRENQNPFTVKLSPVTVDTAESMGLGFFINSETITADSRATLDPPDFSNATTNIMIPARSRSFAVSTFFAITDDNIDEDEQSFAIVAEILDVPEDISCFQTAPGTIPCFGTRGATEIRITDNDPMVIGFTKRRWIEYENMTLPGENSFTINIPVDTLRTAERVHPMLFRLQMSSGPNSAIVNPIIEETNEDFDAIFGSRMSVGAPIIQEFDLVAEMDTIEPLVISIINDFIPEEEECFTIRIFPIDVPGRRELFVCNEDGSNATNHFCEITVCIKDDDESFKVAFVEKTYTVDESVGAVEVCVNLTNPVTEIFDETVNVFVIDYSSSVYIPDGVPLATPDEPNFLSQYSMVEGTDFVQQTIAVNVIDDIIISELMRMICYNQTIYDDMCVEEDEYAGLTLGVLNNARTTVFTEVEPMYDQVSILIVDNDGMAVVGLERTFYNVTEGDGAVEVCVVVHMPDWPDCPICFPFTIYLSTKDNSAEDPMDYHAAVREMVDFESCDKRKCVNIEIEDDDIFENTEFFDLILEGNGLSDRIRLEPVDGVVEIIDNELARVGLEQTYYEVSEDVGVVEVCAVVYMPDPSGPCPIDFDFTVLLSTVAMSAGSPSDYVEQQNEPLSFAACTNRSSPCVTIPIVDDNTAENVERFGLRLGRNGLESRITLDPENGIVQINDNEVDPPDLVNDTVTGDPLMTVPIYTTPEDTLCYEVHGETDQTFNLISDNCVAVNAHYTRAVANNPNITLNVIDSIGVRAVATDDTCVNISVNLEGCVAMVNDQPGSVPYQHNGISVRKYNNRVRIVVPNCGETDLVMWVFCTSGSTADPKTNIYYNFDFLRFVVRRGLNLNERSHGLIGQFWNIKIDVQEHLGLFNGNIRSDDYNITVRHPGSSPRSFVAIQSSVTWEFEKKPCLYVGNSQAGPLGEDVDPNDSVIEGTYKDYMVESVYSPNFKFAHIDENNCMTK